MALVDIASTVSGIAFSDKDLDTKELGGDLAWNVPGKSTNLAACF